MIERPLEDAHDDEALRDLFEYHIAKVTLPFLVFRGEDPGPLLIDGETAGNIEKQGVIWDEFCAEVRADPRFRYLDLDDPHLQQKLWIIVTLPPLVYVDEVNRFRTHSRRELLERLDPARLEVARSRFPEAF